MKTKFLGWTLFFLAMELAIPLPAQQPAPSSNTNAGFEMCKRDAEEGFAGGELALGMCYANGLGVATNYVEAVKWYRKAADQNATAAECELGVCYANGQGVAEDDVEAVKWYRKAAERNYAEAQYNLGNCFANGRGVAKDDLEAVKWYRKAAGQNYAEAQGSLGNCYANGQGVAKDDMEAAKWYRKAAEQNCFMAQGDLFWGIKMEHAAGETNVEADTFFNNEFTRLMVEAIKWYQNAADLGDAKAQYNLGVCYDQGQGVAQDHAEAVKLYRKAANQGFGEAQNELGLCYGRPPFEGLVPPRAFVKAVEWYRGVL